MNAKRNCDSGAIGVLKKAEQRSITVKWVVLLGILARMVAGFTMMGSAGMVSFTALRSCTNLHVDFLGFRTGKIGVLHWLTVGIIVPCFNNASTTGAIPASASGRNGYCGLRGSFFDVSILIFTECMLPIRPTSLACVAHRQVGACSSSPGNFSDPRCF